MWQLWVCMTTCTSLYLLLYSFFSVKMTRKFAVWFPKHYRWTPFREQIPVASFFFPLLFWERIEQSLTIFKEQVQLIYNWRHFFHPKYFNESSYSLQLLSTLILTLSNKNTNILLHRKIISPKVKQKLLVIISKSKLWLHIP